MTTMTWIKGGVAVALLSGCAAMAPLQNRMPTNATAMAEPALSGKQVFGELRKFAGEWHGNVTKLDGPAATVNWRVTAGGSAVMETQFVGTPHEMVSVYHLDGDTLMLTHYCAAQNQPRMKLKSANAREWVFEFAGGTNLDPEKDTHVHEGRIRPGASDYEADWAMYTQGKPSGVNKFFMRRKS